MNAEESAIKAGIDLSLIKENLLLSPEERLMQHQAALNSLNTLLEARAEQLKTLVNVQPQQPAS